MKVRRNASGAFSVDMRDVLEDQLIEGVSVPVGTFSIYFLISTVLSKVTIYGC